MLQTLKQPETNTRLPYSIQRPSYEEAKAIIRGQVFSHAQYKTFRENNPQFYLPASPVYVYRNEGWVSAYEFFGTTSSGKERFLNQFWVDVKSGKRERPTRKKTKNATQVKKSPEKTKVTVTQSQPTTTLQDKQTFIALAKKLGVYDQFKPAFKTLFTYDELLDLMSF